MRFGIVLVLLLTACGPAASPSPSTHNIGGTLTLSGSGAFQTDAGHVCAGVGGYSDIAAGAEVTIKDQAGTVIALGTLDRGASSASDPSSCVFPFSVPNVPKATFYSIEISHRGELRYSAADLAARNWSVGLTLGGN